MADDIHLKNLQQNIAELMKKASCLGTFGDIFKPNSPNLELSLYIYFLVLQYASLYRSRWDVLTGVILKNKFKEFLQDNPTAANFCEDFINDFDTLNFEDRENNKSKILKKIKTGIDLSESDSIQEVDLAEEDKIELSNKLRLFLYYIALEDNKDTAHPGTIQHSYLRLHLKIWELNHRFFYRNIFLKYSAQQMQAEYQKICDKVKVELLVEKYKQVLQRLKQLEEQYKDQCSEKSWQYSKINELHENINDLCSKVVKNGIARVDNYEDVKNQFLNVFQKACADFSTPPVPTLENAKSEHPSSTSSQPKTSVKEHSLLQRLFNLMSMALGFISEISSKFRGPVVRESSTSKDLADTASTRSRSASSASSSVTVSDASEASLSERDDFVSAIKEIEKPEVTLSLQPFNTRPETKSTSRAA